eukprot:TRINITY_DN309_c0_g1_i1.p1 TRINITY_DN309_c0_g1~~TRINITY_DN309_c0_g1_i1.p1  ORF type:complete len:281 (-),score=69.12 TRINITY_DN309_c0_g1_i1:187-1029(-)
MATSATANDSQFNFDPFWKSQTIDTISQMYHGSNGSSIPPTTVPADVPNKDITPSLSGNAITSSLSFSSLMPSFSGTGLNLQQSASGTFSSIFSITPSASQTGLNHNSANTSNPSGQMMETVVAHGQANEASASNPVQINNATLPASPMPSNDVNSMLATFQNSQLATATPPSKELVKVDKEPTYVDVTPFLVLPQHEAARRLGVPCSTLSKRWKEASVNRKWPHRILCKLDKEITTLLKNVENSTRNNAASLSPEIEESLGVLLKKRQEELRTVILRLN